MMGMQLTATSNTITVNVTAVNDAPVAATDDTASVNEDATLQPFQLHQVVY